MLILERKKSDVVALEDSPIVTFQSLVVETFGAILAPFFINAC
jgi:hypothetical protein